jgi:type IV pilus assembly protein PilQ
MRNLILTKLFIFKLLLYTVLLLSFITSFAQGTPDTERLRLIQERLNNLAVTVPGLNQKVQLNVSNVSAQEFLRALAQANNLNINIDPQLNFKVYNNFTNESALNVLVFLAKQYSLDINLIGSIMSVTRVPDQKPVVVVKEINAQYNGQNNTLSVDLNGDSLVQVAQKIARVSSKNVVVPNSLLSKRLFG